MEELTTPEGLKFRSMAYLETEKLAYPLEQMDEWKQINVVNALNLKGLNAAFAGEKKFICEGIPSVQEILFQLSDSVEPPGT